MPAARLALYQQGVEYVSLKGIDIALSNTFQGST